MLIIKDYILNKILNGSIVFKKSVNLNLQNVFEVGAKSENIRYFDQINILI